MKLRSVQAALFSTFETEYLNERRQNRRFEVQARGHGRFSGDRVRAERREN